MSSSYLNVLQKIVCSILRALIFEVLNWAKGEMFKFGKISRTSVDLVGFWSFFREMMAGACLSKANKQTIINEETTGRKRGHFRHQKLRQ